MTLTGLSLLSTIQRRWTCAAKNGVCWRLLAFVDARWRSLTLVGVAPACPPCGWPRQRCDRRSAPSTAASSPGSVGTSTSEARACARACACACVCLRVRACWTLTCLARYSPTLRLSDWARSSSSPHSASRFVTLNVPTSLPFSSTTGNAETCARRDVMCRRWRRRHRIAPPPPPLCTHLSVVELSDRVAHRLRDPVFGRWMERRHARRRRRRVDTHMTFESSFLPSPKSSSVRAPNAAQSFSWRISSVACMTTSTCVTRPASCESPVVKATLQEGARAHTHRERSTPTMRNKTPIGVWRWHRHSPMVTLAKELEHKGHVVLWIEHGEAAAVANGVGDVQLAQIALHGARAGQLCKRSTDRQSATDNAPFVGRVLR